MYKKVLVPVSGGHRCLRSQKALKKALQLCSGEMIILHVTEPISQAIGGEQRQELERQSNAQGALVLNPIIEELELSAAAFHTRIVPGTPAETIVRVADEENADLIVMFTDGRDGFKDMLLGSITERVLRNTAIDLLAVRDSSC